MAKKPALHKHVVASFISVAPHAHTGKRIASRHSSHGFLLVVLAFTGALLFSNLGAFQAFGLSSSVGPTISVGITGTPPSQAAEILYPENNKITKVALLEVSGTCPSETLVAIYNNGIFTGSTTCTIGGEFAITIQLLEGINTLQAQNYDGMNQPGPLSPQVSITYQPEIVINPENPSNPVVAAPQQLDPAPTIPSVPITVPQPSTQPCYDLPKANATTNTATPLISVGCIHRNYSVGDTIQLPFSVSGGSAPYALLVEWGDGKTDLISISDSSIQKVRHAYETPGFKEITLHTTDSKGVKSQIQTVVVINGTPVGAAPLSPTDSFFRSFNTFWVQASVPLYIAALTLVLGFWIGDIFQHFLNSQSNRKIKKRHA